MRIDERMHENETRTQWQQEVYQCQCRIDQLKSTEDAFCWRNISFYFVLMCMPVATGRRKHTDDATHAHIRESREKECCCEDQSRNEEIPKHRQ
jgi:hypothetical protein